MTADDFSRRFAAAFAARDAAALSALLAPDAGVQTLTGQWADSRATAQRLFAAEFQGTLARARLVTGRTQLRTIAAEVAVLDQRYVVSGATDAAGGDLPRFAAMLTAVLVDAAGGCHAASLSFCALSED